MNLRRSRTLLWVAIGTWAVGLLSIELTSDWHRLHEDNGAMHTTFALSHLELGLATTRAHDVFFNPADGHVFVYGHHPAATGLVLAAAFGIAGSSAPWVARSVAIAFHLGTLLLLVWLFARFFRRSSVLFGGFVLATLPMSAYFGRMVNYEPLCLFGVMVLLAGYAAYKLYGSRGGLGLLGLGVVLGGLVDWTAFFFAAAIALVEAWDLWQVSRASARALAVVIGAAVATFLFDLGHLWYVGSGSLASLRDVLARDAAGVEGPSVVGFVLGQIEAWRLYYTHVGLGCAGVVAFAVVRPASRLARKLFEIPHPEVARRILFIAAGAQLAYLLAAPSWAADHAYWQFYGLPYVGFSIVLVWAWALRRVAERPSWTRRLVPAVIVLEILATTTYTLNLRYTTPGEYAIRQTAYYRANFLTAEDLTDTAR